MASGGRVTHRQHTARPGNAVRAVPHRNVAGRGRHGAGIPIAGYPAGTYGSAEDIQSGVQRAVRARGARGSGAESSQCLHHSRCGPQLPGDGTGGGADTSGPDEGRPDSAGRGAAHRAADRGRAGGGPRERHRSSRPEARQHQNQARRHGEGAGFRTGQVAARRCRAGTSPRTRPPSAWPRRRPE